MQFISVEMFIYVHNNRIEGDKRGRVGKKDGEIEKYLNFVSISNTILCQQFELHESPF